MATKNKKPLKSRKSRVPGYFVDPEFTKGRGTAGPNRFAGKKGSGLKFGIGVPKKKKTPKPPPKKTGRDKRKARRVKRRAK